MAQVDLDDARGLPTHAASFFRWLRRQKHWMIQASLDAYEAIGRYQLRFLEERNPLLLAPLPVTKLPEMLDLNLHGASYYRLLRGRWVEVAAPEGNSALPVRFLLPTEHTIKGYFRVRALNALFRMEYSEGHAYSDQDLASASSSMSLSRRTVTKYRVWSQTIVDRLRV